MIGHVTVEFGVALEILGIESSPCGLDITLITGLLLLPLLTVLRLLLKLHLLLQFLVLVGNDLAEVRLYYVEAGHAVDLVTVASGEDNNILLIILIVLQLQHLL